MTTLLSSATSRSIAIFAAGVVGAGGLLGLPRATDAGQTEATRSMEPARSNACGGADQVAAFVCRNTWLAATRYGNR
jgi:hypothetical protein